MDKGTRVRVVRGPDKGKVGAIFWIGENRYGPGKRLGVRCDDGETVWIDADNAEETDAPAAPPPASEGPAPERGSQVRWERGGETQRGEVFWVGPSKNGPGLRVGIRDGAGETHWMDAVQVRVDESAEAAPAERDRVDAWGGGARNDDEPPPPTWAEGPDLDAPPPWLDPVDAPIPEPPGWLDDED